MIQHPEDRAKVFTGLLQKTMKRVLKVMRKEEREEMIQRVKAQNPKKYVDPLEGEEL